MAKINNDEVMAGEYAFLCGKPMSANPYQVGSLSWGRWHHGWTKAAREKGIADAGHDDADL